MVLGAIISGGSNWRQAPPPPPPKNTQTSESRRSSTTRSCARLRDDVASLGSRRCAPMPAVLRTSRDRGCLCPHLAREGGGVDRSCARNASTPMLVVVPVRQRSRHDAEDDAGGRRRRQQRGRRAPRGGQDHQRGYGQEVSEAAAARCRRVGRARRPSGTTPAGVILQSAGAILQSVRRSHFAVPPLGVI
jgi:hypothetical protein